MNVNYTNHNHRIVDASIGIKFPSLDSSPQISKLFSTLSAISRKNGPEIGTQEFKSNDSDSLLHTPPSNLMQATKVDDICNSSPETVEQIHFKKPIKSLIMIFAGILAITISPLLARTPSTAWTSFKSCK